MIKKRNIFLAIYMFFFIFSIGPASAFASNEYDFASSTSHQITTDFNGTGASGYIDLSPISSGSNWQEWDPTNHKWVQSSTDNTGFYYISMRGTIEKSEDFFLEKKDGSEGWI